MSVSSTGTRVALNGDGVTAAFAWPYRFLATTDLKVYVGGVLKTITTHYTVSAPGSSGTVTFTAGNIPAAGTGNVVITRATAKTQGINFIANDPFGAGIANGGYDRAQLGIQDVDAKASRAVRAPDYEAALPVLPDAATRADGGNGTVGVYDADGNPTVATYEDLANILIILRGDGIVTLTADLTLYVRTDGDDDNTGLVDSAGGAFQTIQKAVDFAYGLNCGGFKVTIRVGAGTYTAGFKLIGRLWNAYDDLRRPFQIIGDSDDPSNVELVVPSANAVELWDAVLYLDGVSISTTTGGYGMLVRFHSNLELGKIRIGDVAGEMIACQFNSTIDVGDDMDVAGDANSFCHITKNSLISFTNQTISFSKVGGNSFDVYVWGINNGSVECDGCTLTGAIAAGRTTIHDRSFVNFYSVTDTMTTSRFGPGTLNIEDGSVVTDTLQATLNYYVNPLGSDDNDGLANTAARAFETIQGALDRLSTFPRDNNKPSAGFSAKIMLADGTYAETVKLRSMSAFERVRIIGNASTPANVVIAGVTDAISGTIPVDTGYSIESCKLTAAAGSGLRAEAGNRISFTGVNFGACSVAHMQTNAGGVIQCAGSYTISGGGAFHIYAANGGVVDYGAASITVTLAANVTFSTATVKLANLCAGHIDSGNVTWSLGSFAVTGKRYEVTGNSVLDTDGGGASYIPGNSSGSLGGAGDSALYL